MPTAPLIIHQRTRTLVQVAASWPVDDAQWLTVDGWAEGSEDGFCNDVGAATIVIPGGLVFLPGDTTVALGVPVDLVGKYVRICEASDAGSIADIDGSTYSPAWWGIVVGQDFGNDSEQHGLQITYECAGVLAIMDQVTPLVHYAAPQSPSQPVADIGTAALFNAIGKKKTGNRSADLYDFGDGVSSYVFDNSGDGEEWTALQAANYVLAIFKLSSPGSPILSLGGQLTALGWTEKFDLGGMNALEMLTRIINPKQGVGYIRGAVSPSGVVIDVMSLSQVEIPSGSFTLPANGSQVILDATEAGNISRPRINQNQRSTYDVVAVEMEKNQYAITLGLADMEPDWTPQDEIDKDALDEDDPALDEAPCSNVGRRFKLRADWIGTGISGFTMPTTRITETSDLCGNQGYSGELTIGDQYVKKAQFRFLKELPFPDGYDWSTQDPADADLTKKNAPPVVLAISPDGEYFPLGELCDPPIEKIQINIDECGPVITLGPAKVADTVLELIDDGWNITFTVGIEAQMETIVSHVSPSASPRGAPRVFKKERKGLKRRFITPGTTLGIDTGTTQRQSPGTLVAVQDDLPLAKSILAAVIPWYTQPDWTVSHTWVGVIDKDSFPPGTMIVQTKYFEGDGTITTVDMIGVVTKNARKYAEPGETSITTKRIEIAVEAVL
jgi:hypothetical protein